jgi:hypothetical protein
MTISREMIERSAKAVIRQHHGFTPAELQKCWNISGQEWIQQHLDDARDALEAAGVGELMAALIAIRDREIPDVDDACFQRRARQDLQEISRAVLAKVKAA